MPKVKIPMAASVLRRWQTAGPTLVDGCLGVPNPTRLLDQLREAMRRLIAWLTYRSNMHHATAATRTQALSPAWGERVTA